MLFLVFSFVICVSGVSAGTVNHNYCSQDCSMQSINRQSLTNQSFKKKKRKKKNKTSNNQGNNKQENNQSNNNQNSSKQTDSIISSGKSAAASDNGDYYETLELDEDAAYDTKDEVCAYLVQFHQLPTNYMTKKEARYEGWEGGALCQVIPGKCIGGDVFGNYEETLPVIDGRVYHECDIDTIGSTKRGAKRIIYSGDDDNGEWNIYYTDDHYETFTLLWGKDNY